jgi:hypothetical protein
VDESAAAEESASKGYDRRPVAIAEVSMSDIPNFAKLVPGFDFLQGLVKNAGTALPSIGQWVAPTLNPEELQKRIDELKTVQFWLEQNARMLGTTIQALEVQKMTLSTLKTMNVQMTDLRDAMKVAPVAAAGPAASAAVGSVADSLGAESLMQAARNAMGGIAGRGKPAAPAPEPAPRAGAQPKAGADAAAAAGVVDPMQWWGALTKQFTQLAAGAMKDSAADAAKNLAGAMMKQGMDAAGDTLKRAVKGPAGVAAKAMSAATQAAHASGAKAAAKKTPARKPPARKTAAGPAKAAKTRAH